MTAEGIFQFVAPITAGICLILAMGWMWAPKLILNIFGIAYPDSAIIVARRGAALFLGIGATFAIAGKSHDETLRHALCAGMAVSCTLLAILGFLERSRRAAGAGIWLAIMVEAALATALVLVLCLN
ncbi:hypothetical protein [Dyella sp. Tek66A03]|uniref:hypothetical protein n=1 Tax=Dyella sp. Tek66A03 TaxID=3458298 RepID=UPI00403ECDD1